MIRFTFSELHPGGVPMGCTSTNSNFYTALIEKSKKHFYGRAAAEEVLATYVLRTFTAAQRSERFYIERLLLQVYIDPKTHCQSVIATTPTNTPYVRRDEHASRT